MNRNLTNYKKHCKPNKSLQLKLAVNAVKRTFDRYDEHPKTFPVIIWLVSFN